MIEHCTGSRDDHSRAAIVPAEIGVEHRRGGRLRRSGRAEDGAADRLVGIGGARRRVEDPVLGRIERRAEAVVALGCESSPARASEDARWVITLVSMPLESLPAGGVTDRL